MEALKLVSHYAWLLLPFFAAFLSGLNAYEARRSVRRVLLNVTVAIFFVGLGFARAFGLIAA